MMTDAQFVKSFSKMIIALIVLTLVLITLGVVIGGSMDDKLQAQTEEYTQRVIAQRTQPIGDLNVGEIADEGVSVAMAASADTAASSMNSGDSEASAGHPGEAVYKQYCYVCHDVGLTGSPKPGDAENWAPRIEKGIATLYDSAINGFQGQRGIMPPKGGVSMLSDEDVQAAVDYLVELVQ
ncbi:MAG: c-type cytochrome [Acidiferrobacterales bacterium]|nr:c-type cytochrome [Acidiferrobacterales bacterium]